MHDITPFRQIGILGTGRVAAALAFALAPHSQHPLLIAGRSPERASALVSRAQGTALARDGADLLTRCDVVALAVSDDALDAVVGDLARAMRRSAPPSSAQFVFHASGRSGAAMLSPLAENGALTAAIHPVMTFTGDAGREVARMQGARFALTGANAQATARARQIVACLGGVPVMIAEQHRALYHAALCHAANHLVTLLAGSSQALAVAGVDDPAALLAPLVRAALDNSLARGFAALSGPLLRGDGATIARHLAAMDRDCPTLLPAYRAMALATLDELDRSDSAPAPDLRAKLQEG
jgi:predicted short-subunit dehydrogenase-like oxidoreductase (DUF2520 family)